jgi:uncharacterized membrane protein YbhN (UPF0104 family)
VSTADSSCYQGRALASNETDSPPIQRRETRGRTARAWLLRLALVAVAIFVITRLARGSDLRAARDLVQRTGWRGAFVLLPTAFAMALDARAWQLILRALGHPVRWRLLARLRVGAESLVLFLPGGAVAGEAAKLALLRRWAGVPVPVGAASQLLVKACLIGAESVYMALGAGALEAVMLVGEGPRSKLPVAVAALGALLTAGISGGLFYVLRDAAAASRLIGLVSKIPIGRVRRWADAQRAEFAETDRATHAFFDAPLATRLRCGGYFLLEWLVEGAEMYLVLWCLGVHLGVPETLVLDGGSSLVRALAFVAPGGLGFQDVTQIAFLTGLGVPDAVTVGVAMIVIKRTKEIFWMLTGVLLLADSRRAPWR